MEILLTQDSGVEIASLTTPAEVEQLLCLFADVAKEQGWQPGEHLRDVPGRSCYLVVTVGGELTGGLQMVLPDTAGRLPCQAVWPEVTSDRLCRAAHITILVLKQPFRGNIGLFWPLCVEAWRFCVSRKVEQVLMEATPQMLARYRRVGWPLEVIGELRLHWGEDCYLCGMTIQELGGVL